jgi:hypothetical protein
LDRVGLRHDGLFSRQRERPGIETRFGHTDPENSRGAMFLVDAIMLGLALYLILR